MPEVRHSSLIRVPWTEVRSYTPHNFGWGDTVFHEGNILFDPADDLTLTVGIDVDLARVYEHYYEGYIEVHLQVFDDAMKLVLNDMVVTGFRAVNPYVPLQPFVRRWYPVAAYAGIHSSGVYLFRPYLVMRLFWSVHYPGSFFPAQDIPGTFFPPQLPPQGPPVIKPAYKPALYQFAVADEHFFLCKNPAALHRSVSI